VCEQVLTQLAGTPPRPWPGADAPEFEAIRSTRTSDWDLDPIAAADDGRIAVDDTNHILAVSAPLAELVGWRVDQLVGRRIIALVPPRFREAHTAGYTRFLATGEAHALGVDLVLPVLTRDGREIDCTFHIHAVARRGQQMFIATITPVDVAAEASA
jgi:PAS domain S-box-containing protein